MRRHRPWRGTEDTARDFLFWLKLWGKLLLFLMPCPLRAVKSLEKYGLLENFLTVPALADDYTGFSRGKLLREKHSEINAAVQKVLESVSAVLNGDKSRMIWVEGDRAELIMQGFSALSAVSIPVVSSVFPQELSPVGVCSIVCHPLNGYPAPPPVLELTDETTLELIRFVEKQTGEKFNWDVFADINSIL